MNGWVMFDGVERGIRRGCLYEYATGELMI
jgi:hypothetical protein